VKIVSRIVSYRMIRHQPTERRAGPSATADTCTGELFVGLPVPQRVEPGVQLLFDGLRVRSAGVGDDGPMGFQSVL